MQGFCFEHKFGVRVYWWDKDGHCLAEVFSVLNVPAQNTPELITYEFFGGAGMEQNFMGKTIEDFNYANLFTPVKNEFMAEGIESSPSTVVVPMHYDGNCFVSIGCLFNEDKKRYDYYMCQNDQAILASESFVMDFLDYCFNDSLDGEQNGTVYCQGILPEYQDDPKSFSVEDERAKKWHIDGTCDNWSRLLHQLHLDEDN